jgi:hypothetical protein
MSALIRDGLRRGMVTSPIPRFEVILIPALPQENFIEWNGRPCQVANLQRPRPIAAAHEIVNRVREGRNQADARHSTTTSHFICRQALASHPRPEDRC